MKTCIRILVLLFIFQSCSKKSNTPPPVIKPSTLSLLTQKQWYFDSVYSNYNGSGTGQLTYARGSNNNIQDLDTAHFIYNTNGTEDIYNEGSPHFQVTWGFTDADSTLLYYPVNTYYTTTQYQRIMKLDSVHLTLYDSTQARLNIVSVQP